MSDLFKLLTPFTYWLLIALWSFILIFYIKKMWVSNTKRLFLTLIVILAIDAFRTLFESFYFGIWYTSLAGLIPKHIGEFLMRPEMVIIPKILNVIAAVIVILLLLKGWLPKEEEEKNLQEKALKDSEQMLLNITENIPGVIYEFYADSIGKYGLNYVSGPVEELFGLSNEVEGFFERFVERIPTQKERDAFIASNDEVVREFKEWDFTTRFIKPSGEEIWIRGQSKPARVGERIIFRGVLQDVTERKKNEDKINEQQLLFETMFNTISEGAIITNLNREIILANKGMETTFGYKSDDIIGKSTQILYADNNRYKQTGKDVFNKESLSSDKQYIEYYKHKDNRVFPGETFGAKLFDNNGNWIGNIGIMRDISERKQAEKEKEKLWDQLKQAQKMEAIGTLAGGIAHDFNNILGVIMGYTELTMEDHADNQEIIYNLKSVMNASMRAKDMVGQILAFSRKSDQKMEPVHVSRLIKEVITFLRSSIPTTIEIKYDIEKELDLILGNATQINQVLMNLCTNAAHAMKEEGGLLEIVLKKVILDKDNSTLLDIKPGIYQQLSMSDTGTGISNEIIDRIFEPYFTTKKAGEGTGMGLAVIYGIIKSHGGGIKVYSELNKGTVFNVYFPVMVTEKIKEKHVSRQLSIMGNNEMILFVDDEVTLVELGAKMLEKLGFRVNSRNSSAEALRVFKNNPYKFDLVITDMTMPNMTGVKLANEIHKIRPDIPVILCTGFSKGINNTNYKAQGISAMIMKPIVKKELVAAIIDVLTKKSNKSELE